MKRIVITGGLGFIFSDVTEHFLARGYDVYVIDNLSTGSHPELLSIFKKYNDTLLVTTDKDYVALEALDMNSIENGEIKKMPSTDVRNITSRFTFIEQDVCFAEVVPIIETINPDYIIHAAAISDVDYSIREPGDTIAANCSGTTQVFEAARKCTNLKKLLYVSTDEVYGECYHPKTEDEILFPRNPYACSKAFGSLLRLAYDNTYPELKDKTCETRFCNVWGPRQDDRKIIPAIVRALKGGEPLQLHNGGEGYRQYIYVLEIPWIIETLLQHGNRTYNITAGEGYTVKDLITLAENITLRKVPIVSAKRQGMDARYEMSGKRFETEFDWSPLRHFEEQFEYYLHDNLD